MPIVISVVAVYSSYWFKFANAIFSSQFLWVIISAIVGAYFFSNVVIQSPTKKLLAWLAFAAYLIFVIFWTSLLAACSLGDCL